MRVLAGRLHWLLGKVPQYHTPANQTTREPAVKAACSLDSVANHPGTSGFITQEYTGCLDFIGTITACVD